MATISCHNEPIPLCLIQGDSFVIRIRFTDKDGVDVDTTGWTVLSQIRYGDADNNAVITELEPSWEGSIITLTLTAVESDLIPAQSPGQEYAWDAKVTDTDLDVSTVAYGPVTLQPTISRVQV